MHMCIYIHRRVMRSMDMWKAIFAMPPPNGWKTKGLTEDKLRIAFNQSAHNKALFLDKSGNRLYQIG
jgi:hypothetical protein